jgi:hypothetical protein
MVNSGHDWCVYIENGPMALIEIYYYSEIVTIMWYLHKNLGGLLIMIAIIINNNQPLASPSAVMISAASSLQPCNSQILSTMICY